MLEPMPPHDNRHAVPLAGRHGRDTPVDYSISVSTTPLAAILVSVITRRRRVVPSGYDDAVAAAIYWYYRESIG